MYKILLTSTSFIDTPGEHQVKLFEQGFNIDKMRGPLKAEEILQVIDKYDGIICGDDEITEMVIKRGVNSKLKIISKYGVGLDKVDLRAAKKHGLPVTNCPGCNQISVAEHVFSLLLSYSKNIHIEHNVVQNGKWKRFIGSEIFGKSIGIVGLGAVGREVAKRAKCFGLKVFYYDPFVEKVNTDQYLDKCNTINEIFNNCEIVSLHLPLNKDTNGLINKTHFNSSGNNCKVLINTSRANIINQIDLIDILNACSKFAYLTDVLEQEPLENNHPLLGRKNVIITPHIGSRTYESVERTGLMAFDNLLKGLGLN